MPIDASGYWYPSLCPKQLEVYNCSKRYTLVSGPKKSGKTLVNMHRLMRHAYETPGARIGMFAKTVKNAKAGGIWNDITEIALPEWVNNKITRVTTRKSDGTYGVKQDPQSRMMFFRIKNAMGGNSEFQLHSIDNENEVESIAKGTRFSCFYFAELSNFRKRLVFDITTDQLRMPGMAFEDHLWLADTNPADDGPDSWIHDIWYKLLDKPNPTPQEKQLIKHLGLIEIMIEENLFLSDEEKADLYARFSHDRDLEARYLKGKWVRATEGGLFSDHFKPDIHVIGDCSNVDESEWEMILPQEKCHTLLSGWDLGDRFHSAHIIEPLANAHPGGMVYSVIDEIHHLEVHENVGISDFVEAFMERYMFWERLIGRRPEWRHWSDMAALQNFRAGAETYDKNLIYKYSGDMILVSGAPKFPGSVQKRVNMLRMLLHERRLIVSARCFQTIEMFKSLRKGTGARAVAESKFRHVFDSLSYAISGEEPALVMDEILDGETEKGRLLSVSL